MDVKAGDFVKLKKPVFNKTYGQGNPPEGMRISKDDITYFIPWDSVLKISETCDHKNGIAELNAKPYPLLHINFYNEYKESFEIIVSGQAGMIEED